MKKVSFGKCHLKKERPAFHHHLAGKRKFYEKIKGSIEPGKLADFVMFDRDIIRCLGSEIPDAKVLLTFVQGKKVFGNEE